MSIASRIWLRAVRNAWEVLADLLHRDEHLTWPRPRRARERYVYMQGHPVVYGTLKLRTPKGTLRELPRHMYISAALEFYCIHIRGPRKLP